MTNFTKLILYIFEQLPTLLELLFVLAATWAMVFVLGYIIMAIIWLLRKLVRLLFHHS